MKSVTFKGITFKDIERKFFEIGCEISRTLLQELLEEVDKELAKSRNKAELRHKGSRSTTIKTLMGEVTVDRVIYKKVRKDGGIEHIHLLDEALGFDTIGTISPNLVEKIVEHSTEMAYREVADAVREFTNQTISHQGVWNIVQAVGEKQAEAERSLQKAYKNNQLKGSREIPVLFEEADGLWLSMQGKSRKNKSNGKKELKIGIAYEGWEKRYPLSKEYQTVEKMAFAGYMKAEDFKTLRDSAIAEKYNVDEIQYRILNGDGAAWIKNGHDLETDIFQLDPYHLAKCVIRNVYDKQSRRHIMRWLKAGEFEKAFKKIEELKYECGGLASEIKKLGVLETYIRSNIDGILVYKNRDDIKLPPAPDGIEYRNLGTMERNVGIFSKRMKGAKSWSEKGATNLAKIIALKMGSDFKPKISALVSGKLSERLTERFEETIRNTNKVLNKKVKKKLYPLHRGGMPFSSCKVTNGRKAIRSMFDLRTFSEIIYR
jgi:hypothetical protein